MLYRYFFWAIALISFIWKVTFLVKTIKEKKSSRIKAELFFLALMIVVAILIIIIDNNYSDK
jgi:Ca2+/Na+ antiporter